MEAAGHFTWLCLLVFNLGQICYMQRPGYNQNIHHRGFTPILAILKRTPVLTVDGKHCKIPFLLGGSLRFACESRWYKNKTWCATTHNFDRDREWGFCAEQTSRETVFRDHCVGNPCKNGGTCTNMPFLHAYHCMCPVEYSGHDCEIAKCFDEAHYVHYDNGESWARIHKAKVEQCTCTNSRIDCHSGDRYTVCTVNPCLNGGACRLMISTGMPVCACRGEFVGKYCNIDLRQQCYNPGNATEYRGVEKKSSSGHSCLKWDSGMLHREIRTTTQKNYILRGLGSHPYCRSPDKDAAPWCYVMKQNHLSWEDCSVPVCFDKARRIVEDAVVFAAAKPKCGRKHEKRVMTRGRILGGLSALPGSHPWLAAIYIGNAFCAGSLIMPCWVVSAAHCFANSPPKSSVRVVLGQQLFNTTTDVTQTFEIDRYIFHPEYSVFKPNEHDLVLVKLKKKDGHCAKKTPFVQTICLPEDGIAFEEGYACDVSGWGRMNEDSTDYATVLQEAIVPIVSDNKCSSPEVYGSELSENMFCAGYFDCDMDACQGDSGGPLACQRDKTSYLYGIVSWGDGCGRLNKPGVYTKVSNYVQWINGKIMPKN
ncbi:LOW QUALITY PROTEIN: hepatocyte growth factor activator [Bufo gargarizans]|uniref:LOW QUALITY PROTEIN: hepatocyte growth factor activator n=1 Tax=Bufo gargarizans TaxID=30331 RepID=UPI001CF10E79|nr:LOW QUALITY PROTEIN: hepatocyte growth factor activator [Bufo gargarizans]